MNETTTAMNPRAPQPAAEPLASVTHGRGEAIFVGLHGWNGSHETFSPLVEHLPDNARLINLDLPGYGQSSPPAQWSLPAIARQIIATIDEEVGRAPVSLLGSCSGGVIGLFVAEQLADRLERFIFLEPFAYVPDYLRIFVRPFFGRLFYYSAFGNPVGRWITNRALSGHRQDDTDMMASFARGSLEVPLRYLNLFDQIPAAEEFAALPGQLELVYGEHTFEAIEESVAIWSRVWPHAIDHQIDGAGHLLLSEAPAAVADWIFKTSETPPSSEPRRSDG